MTDFFFQIKSDYKNNDLQVTKTFFLFCRYYDYVLYAIIATLLLQECTLILVYYSSKGLTISVRGLQVERVPPATSSKEVLTQYFTK